MMPIESAPPPNPPQRRLAKLFKVLVVGGAVLAGAYVSALNGGPGSAGTDTPPDGGDGGTQGW